MKMKFFILLVLLSIPAHAVISIVGTGVVAVKGSDGITSIPTGALGLLIADRTGDGFFDLGNPVSNTALTAAHVPQLLPSEANLTIGSTFGGETILNVLASPGGGTFSGFCTGRSIAGLEGRNFAVVWFSDILAAGAPSTAPIGATWGIIRGSDWTLPGGDIGSYPINSTDSSGTGSYYQVNALNGGSPATAFRTTTNGIIGGASFVIVPEPATGLLGVLGVLVSLRRRRI